MRLLANENIPAEAITALRAAGHDVEWVAERMSGATDLVVLDRARTEDRLLITFDKDFGELVFRRGRGASAGLVLFRISCPTPAAVAARVAAALASRDDWAGSFSVVEDDRIRMTALPSASAADPAS